MDLPGEKIVASDQQRYVAFGLEFAARMLVPGGVMDARCQPIEGLEKGFGRNEAMVGQARIALLQRLGGYAAQQLAVALLRMKAHAISVEKSEIVKECKFRHSLNSAIRP
jgi:hypothetical protein